MSDRPSKTLADLTESWPNEPGNDDLARLGQDLFFARPELSQLALDRIQIRMRQEMNRPWWRRRWRTILALIVGVIALAVGVYGWIANSSSLKTAHQNAASRPDAAIVQDHYQVTLPPTSPKAPDKPVIDLNRYNDLFGRDAKEPKR